MSKCILNFKLCNAIDFVILLLITKEDSKREFRKIENNYNFQIAKLIVKYTFLNNYVDCLKITQTEDCNSAGWCFTNFKHWQTFTGVAWQFYFQSSLVRCFVLFEWQITEYRFRTVASLNNFDGRKLDTIPPPPDLKNILGFLFKNITVINAVVINVLTLFELVNLKYEIIFTSCSKGYDFWNTLYTDKTLNWFQNWNKFTIYFKLGAHRQHGLINNWLGNNVELERTRLEVQITYLIH